MSCKKSDDTLTKVFNQTELKTIDEIIKYYDDYVLSQTDNQLSIDKAYIAFFEKISPLVDHAADFYKFTPDIDQQIVFYQTLDKKVLSEIFEMKDTLTIRFRGENEPRKVYRPYSFDLNLHGKYVAFLKDLSSRNDFFKNYYESIEVAGGISPVNYAMMLHDYNKIDFSKEEERLVVIIHFLQTREPIQSDK
jgi:hypothetical protein